MINFIQTKKKVYDEIGKLKALKKKEDHLSNNDLEVIGPVWQLWISSL